MRNLLALGLASMVAADDVLKVELSVDNAEVHKGEGVTFTCEWRLDDSYGEIPDYEMDDFQLLWKVKDVEDGVSQAMARWEAGSEKNDITYYQNNRGTGRINVTAEFDDQKAQLAFEGLDLEDDNMEIICEVHWSARFSEDSETVNVYVDASAVVVEEIETILEGRASNDGNGTITEVVEATVASCAVYGVYPEPSNMVFTIDGADYDVADVAVTPTDEGLFDMTAELVLFPEGKYDGAVISCTSQAAASAEIVEPATDANSTDITLAVYYYTDSVELTITGANGDAGEYNINEGSEYSVSCVANGNPLPEVSITDVHGNAIESGTGVAAVRSEDGSAVQYISCSAENNDDIYSEGEAVEEAASLDVYYLEEPTTDVAVTYMKGSEAVFNCEATAHPAAKISWAKDGVAISNVNFESITYDDAGSYTCTATNAAGSASTSNAVAVDGPCDVSIERKEASSSKSVEGAAALELSCLVKGPECTVTWSSDAEGMMNGGDITDNQSGLATTSTFILTAVDKQAKSVAFTCTGTNSHGVEEDTVDVGENHQPFCCEPAVGGLGTGAIVGIVIAIPAILIIVGAVVFFCRKSGSSDGEKIDGGSDEEAAEPEEKAPLTEGDSGEPGVSGPDKV